LTVSNYIQIASNKLRNLRACRAGRRIQESRNAWTSRRCCRSGTASGAKNEREGRGALHGIVIIQHGLI
jgi:hypothetical protein